MWLLRKISTRLLPTGIARVHGDHHRAGWAEFNLCVLKDKALKLGLDGKLDGQDLVCND